QSLVVIFSFYCSRPPRDLHSFPTRRSSDLSGRRASSVTGASTRGRPGPCSRRTTPYISSRGWSVRSASKEVASRACGRSPGWSSDRKSTRLNSSHSQISYAVFCLKKKIEKQPWDGETSGELQVRGPWIARTYYNDERSPESFTPDVWLKTGDMAVVTPDAYIRLVDRTKDVIKSGGAWISSVDLENAIMGHPKVAEAAVIGVAHPKWSERPLACVVVKPGEELTKDELLAWLEDKVAKWWLPDDVA